ncbi:gamma-glutamyltransferase [Gammaproteobacteria bacterium]|nr:gamma-glutamyltransferase [Gammaproteobacteria bacterium]
MNYPSSMRTTVITTALMLGACQSQPPPNTDIESIAPEQTYAVTQDRALVVGQGAMVAAAHPIAVAAGEKALSEGGSAADAAVAVQLALNLVEPQSSGLGGGAFLVYWDAEARELITIDGRESAPLSANQNYWLADDGEPLDFWTAVQGGALDRRAWHAGAVVKSACPLWAAIVATAL